METNPNLENLMKRPIRYWYEDGFGELVTGVLFVFIGGFLLFQELVTHSLVKAIAGILGMVIIGGSPFLGRFFIKRFKEKLVFPRSGYVKFPTAPKKRRIITMAVAAFVAIGLIVLVTQYQDILYWLPLLQGVAVGGLLLSQAAQIGFPRLYAEAAASVLLGAGVSLLGLGDNLGSGIYFSGFGLVMSVIGGIVLIQYLKKNSDPTDPV